MEMSALPQLVGEQCWGSGDGDRQNLCSIVDLLVFGGQMKQRSVRRPSLEGPSPLVRLFEEGVIRKCLARKGVYSGDLNESTILWWIKSRKTFFLTSNSVSMQRLKTQITQKIYVKNPKQKKSRRSESSL